MPLGLVLAGSRTVRTNGDATTCAELSQIYGVSLSGARRIVGQLEPIPGGDRGKHGRIGRRGRRELTAEPLAGPVSLETQGGCA